MDDELNIDELRYVEPELTVREARKIIFSRWEGPKGMDCHECGQRVKLYRWRLTSTLARTLIAMYHRWGVSEEYVHITDIFKASRLFQIGGAFGKLRHWGLVDHKPKEEADGDKRCSGFWRLRPEGAEFVEHKRKIAKYLYLYNARVIRRSEEQVGVAEALGKRFSYAELMGYGAFKKGPEHGEHGKQVN